MILRNRKANFGGTLHEPPKALLEKAGAAISGTSEGLSPKPAFPAAEFENGHHIWIAGDGEFYVASGEGQSLQTLVDRSRKECPQKQDLIQAQQAVLRVSDRLSDLEERRALLQGDLLRRPRPEGTADRLRAVEKRLAEATKNGRLAVATLFRTCPA